MSFSTSFPNHYKTLGLEKNATEEEIKKAYRKLCLVHHPDRNSSKETTAIQEINLAYETLSDPQLKKQYDWQINGGGGGGENVFFQEFHGGGGATNIQDFFSMIFGQHNPEIRIFEGGGGGGFPPHPFFQHLQKPPPIIKNIQINIEQSYTGCKIPIEIERFVCANGMKHMEKETIYVNIYEGIDNNEIIIIQGKGNVIDDDIKGDIKMIVSVVNNTPFVRMGLDLIFKKSISLKEALCGFSFEMKHLNNKILFFNNNASTPTVIKPHFKKLIPNMGMTRDNMCGNLIVDFEIEFPNEFTSEQIESLKTIL